jgi:hypothetical protein
LSKIPCGQKENPYGRAEKLCYAHRAPPWGLPFPLFPVRELLGIEKELGKGYPLAKFYHGFFRRLGDGKLSRVKTSQSEDPEEARVRKPGKKGGARGFRAANLADVPTPPSPLRRVRPRHNPEHFPRWEGRAPSPPLQARGKDHWGSR